eukprot:m.879171 g.879171  ORF g.879171 m.879171 type:complete len:155 (+) comp59842_c0_seq1:4386-4850(+)
MVMLYCVFLRKELTDVFAAFVTVASDALAGELVKGLEKTAQGSAAAAATTSTATTTSLILLERLLASDWPGKEAVFGLLWRPSPPRHEVLPSVLSTSAGAPSSFGHERGANHMLPRAAEPGPAITHPHTRPANPARATCILQLLHRVACCPRSI